MTTELQIRLLGGLEIVQAGTTLAAFMSNKAPALLAYLALNPRLHGRDVLATLFWGELSDADAKNNLRQVLTNLRKMVDPHLIVTREAIGFNQAAPYFLDVEAFETQLRHSHDLPPEQCAAQLQAAVALYRGDFLAGFFVRDAPEFETWMLAQKARLRELALHALHRLTQLQISRAQFGRAIDSASQSLAIDPWREEAHRHLMLALVRSGQRSAALAQYTSCQRILQTELGVEPSIETRRLFARIRATNAAIPHNLPPQPTLFVGRLNELAAIETNLLKPDCRLLTLVGVGGIGKTRLALRAAEQMLQMGTFLDGVYFVPLAGLDSPALLATALAEACGLTFAGNRDPHTQLIEFLRTQELLLLLDTFEHLLAASTWLSEILQRAPGVKLLITSRERLNIRWEWLLEVAGLADASAAQLFTLRARTVHAQFEAAGETHAETQLAITQICRLVQGLPLAIELAAASVRHYSCTEIANAIAHNLDLLSTELRDVPARHRSVRAVFDYSWQLLSPPEQQLFPVLAAYPGSFAQPAVLAVTHQLGGIQPAGQNPSASLPALLASLVDKSLVQRSQDGRYQLHALARQYAVEKLMLDPRRHAAVQREHGRFYANFLAQQAAEIGSHRQQTLLSAVEQEIDNVRAAWGWAVAHQPAQELLPMIDSLFEFYEVRSLVQEAGERFGGALIAVQQEAAVASSANLALIKLLNRQGRFLFRQGRRTEAESLLRQALAQAASVADTREMALAYNYLGLVQQWAGDYTEAVRLYQASRTLYQGDGDTVGLARALNNLGVINLRLGNYTEAEAFLQQSLALRRQLGDAKSLADSLNNLGILLHEVGDYARETQLLQEALAAFRQLADRKGIGTVLHNLGGVQLACARYTEARHLLEEALAYRHSDPTGLAHTLNNLGEVALRSGDRRAARDYYQRALQVAWESKAIPITLDILVGIADCLLCENRPGPAFGLLAFVRQQAQDSDTLTATERLLALARQATPPPAAQFEVIGADRTIEQTVAAALQELD